MLGKPLRGKMFALMAAALAVAGLVSACGSGGAGASAGTSGAKADLTQAKQILAAASQRPTKIQVTDPIGKPVPAGKKIAFVSCGLPECVLQGEVIKKATDLLGWSLTTINTNGTPQGFQNAFDTILRQKVDGVIYNAIDKSVIRSQLGQLQSQGAITGACCQLDPVGDGITYVIDTPDDNSPKGKIDAAWAVVNGGDSASVLYANIPDFKILSSIKSGLQTNLKTLCPGCTFDSIDLPLTSLGKDAPNRMVSYLRSHPKTKFVVLADDAAGVGLPAALKAAGLDDVKVFGQAPYGASLGYLKNGTEAGAIPYDLYGDMWAIVDSMARKFAGVAVPTIHPPMWVVTKDNYPTEAGSELFPIVADYDKQYAALWGKA
ncbi:MULTISPECIES: substrate-binding domain-containing protein [unclassified Amycolatopsis]|uniref:sugar ABC transporter substrate-binding protein n=1 Tax=unclassified Amycolatopsis TaxID=2618356 RepID=UPI001C69916F|nr:substrate-binding domain-containing protein [Amycolatopsis sp. DSM 110486]QYN23518.1 substrate-binding domain-containing protein [Amycolatopsis sp. DSM 110486]